MGAVFRARDRDSGRSVAVKVLHDHTPDAARFERECELLAQLDHPAIVRYVGQGRTAAGALFLVEEWLDGQTVYERMAGAGVTIGEAQHIVRRVAEALADVHSRGIVHRDIKPSNLFVVGPIGDVVDDVKVLDFGIARTVRNPSPLTRTGVMVGTPGYFSPEQARGDKQVGPQADVFSLGCVLYECLTGRPAFAGEHLRSLRAKVLIAEPPPPSHWRREVSGALDRLVAAMLAKDAGARPADGKAVASAIAALPAPPETGRVHTASADEVTAASPARLRMLDDAKTPVRFVTEVVSIVLAAGDDSDAAQESARFAATSSRSAALVESIRGLGGELNVLADGSVLSTVIGTDERDVAARSARAALAIRELLPELSMVLVTSRTGSSPEWVALHDAIERGARNLNAAIVAGVFGELTGVTSGDIRLDAHSAELLSDRYDVSELADGSYSLRVVS
jgi:hypothetical protein